MSVRKVLTSLAVISMVAAPAMAQASSADRLSVASAREGARIGASGSDESKLAGGSVVIAVLAAAAIIAGIVIAADGDDEPVSP